ncbi:MAG: FecR domain-containing protein [Pyrinomonadaceae bacterium]
MMKRPNIRTIAMVVMGLLCFSGLNAQENDRNSVSDKYIISANAGGVNYIEGNVTVIRKNGTSGRLLKRDRVEVGDSVSTGMDGRAEILLNPGSYIRIAGNTTFEFGTTDLEDLRLRLERGSAMFEVFASDEFRVSVFTPRGKTVLMETGVYRVDVLRDGTATVAVTEGRAEVGDSKRTVVKGGRNAQIGTDAVAVTKFDRGDRDELAQWSRSRAKDLTKMTSSLKNRDVRNLLINSFSDRYWMGNSFGLWIFSPFTGSFCFMPYGRGWYSPYGFDYRTGLYWYQLPPARIDPGYGGVRQATKNTNPNSPNVPNVKKTGRMLDDREPSPPYVKMGDEQQKSRKWENPGFPGDNPGRGSGSPIYVPPVQRSIEPVYSPAPVSAPSSKVKPIDN